METPLKILLLEDLPEDVELIEHALRREKMLFVTKRVDERQHFIDALKDFLPDVILSDHSLPQFNSIDALTICRALPIYIPFILVTGAMSDEFAVTCLKGGADDYVLKSNLARLPAAIRATLKQYKDEQQRKQAEDSLLQRNEELIKINDELDRFVYSVSHNLRAPLMSVLGLLNLTKHEKNLTLEGIREYLAMMESSILKLDHTLRNIIDYSRNARQEEEIEKIDIREEITQSFERLKYIGGQERLSKKIEVKGIAPFYSNAYRLSVIFDNLLSNAIKFQDHDKVDPMIAIGVNIDPASATIIVEDNGVGIPDDLHGLIFTMFFRANERSDGSGLGLYIAREMIRKLRGEITVSSQPGVGSRFELIIPNQMEHQLENRNSPGTIKTNTTSKTPHS
jgi:signal transduction histidine kinase